MREWVSLEEESLLQGKGEPWLTLEWLGPLNALWWTCPIMVSRERSGALDPGGRRQGGYQPAAEGRGVPRGLAPVVHTHPGSQMPKEGLLLGHAKAQGRLQAAAKVLPPLWRVGCRRAG